MKTEPSVILLAEDNLAHAGIVRREMLKHDNTYRLEHVVDGEEALDYLYSRNEYANPEISPRPRLIILDLQMPRLSGLDVLKTIKNDPQLAPIPVVILTTSCNERDIATAYACHANSYLMKQFNFADFSAMLESLSSYWLTWNKTPPLRM